VAVEGAEDDSAGLGRHAAGFFSGCGKHARSVLLRSMYLVPQFPGEQKGASTRRAASGYGIQYYRAMNPFNFLAGALRKRAYIALIGFALLIFGTVSFTSLLFKADREIVYEGKMVASFCAKSGICFGHYELAIGNTGRLQQDGITAVVRIAPAKWTASHSVSDLAGDQPRAADPTVKSTTSDNAYTYAIDRLTAGAEIKVRFNCTACSIDELRLAKATPVDIYAAGTLREGDPRVTTLGRRLSLLLTLF
jgi:hypothetical protein